MHCLCSSRVLKNPRLLGHWVHAPRPHPKICQWSLARSLDIRHSTHMSLDCNLCRVSRAPCSTRMTLPRPGCLALIVTHRALLTDLISNGFAHCIVIQTVSISTEVLGNAKPFAMRHCLRHEAVSRFTVFSPHCGPLSSCNCTPQRAGRHWRWHSTPCLNSTKALTSRVPRL